MKTNIETPKPAQPSPRDVAAVNSCCTPKEQESCCEASAKADCCGTTSATSAVPSTCGCR